LLYTSSSALPAYRPSQQLISGTIAAMWPWQAFDWGVFWAIIAAGIIYLIIANIISLAIYELKKWGED
jgi:hypothetical protein